MCSEVVCLLRAVFWNMDSRTRILLGLRSATKTSFFFGFPANYFTCTVGSLLDDRPLPLGLFQELAVLVASGNVELPLRLPHSLWSSSRPVMGTTRPRGTCQGRMRGDGNVSRGGKASSIVG